MLRKLVYQSDLGEIEVLANENGLLGCYFSGQKYFEYGYECEKIIEESSAFLDEAKSWLDDYFSGKSPNPNRLTLVPQGSVFQRKVWKVLVQIPYGETMTYGAIAKQINCGSAQAVGGAVGKNPLSIIIPCHRVLGSQGQLTGYAGGLWRKRWLLEHENAYFEKEKEMFTFYEYPKCSTCRRAKVELQELGVHFVAVDLTVDTPKAEQLKEWMEQSTYTIKNFFNTSGQVYRALGLKDKIDSLSIDEAANLLASNGMLIKRPLLVKDNHILQIGHRKSYGELLKK